MIYDHLPCSDHRLVLAVPVSIGIALFVNEIAPMAPQTRHLHVVLLATIPSVVYGSGAVRIAAAARRPLSSISSATSGIPLVKSLTAVPSPTGLSFMTAGIIVAIIVTPIVTSLSAKCSQRLPSL